MTKAKMAMGIITRFFAVATRVSKASPSSAPSFCQRLDCVGGDEVTLPNGVLDQAIGKPDVGIPAQHGCGHG